MKKRTLLLITLLAVLILLIIYILKERGGIPLLEDPKLHDYHLNELVLPSVHLEELTWPEVEHALEQGMTQIIIPTGGVEQNGPHMVLGKHNYVVRSAAEAIAEEIGDMLVAPVVTYVPEGKITPPEGHMRFPGTISLSEKTFESILEETVLSLKQHGFLTFYFLGDSGGNQISQDEVADRMNSQFRDEGIEVVHLSDYYSQSNGQIENLRGQGFSKSDIGYHAGIRDTSELMSVYPDGVRVSMLKKNGGAEFLTTGVAGDPLKASAEIGEALLKLKIEAAVKQIRQEGSVKP